MPSKPFWIKERNNPQLGTYYVACGQMTHSAAARHENSMYGDNVMRPFNTRAEYQAKLDELKANGESVQ